MRYACAVLPFVICAAGQAGTGPFVQSSFDADAEGWGVVSLESNVSLPPYAFYQPDYSADEGGYISEIDPDGRSFFFDAPSAFLGDVSLAYGYQLSFDLRISADNTNFITDVVLQGAGLTLVFPFNDPPLMEWTHYDVPLLESAGWIKINGQTPTRAEMQAALGALTALRIRGEFSTGAADKGDLDNVGLWAACLCDGDFDQDCDVDIADLNTLLSNFGGVNRAPDDGDMDGDGSVTIVDLAMLLSRFEQWCF
jgi:hypothetical protein